MDSFDKKISDLYNTDQTSNDLPEGFGWEEMNDGIYDKMEEPKKNRKFFLMWWLTFGGSVVLLSVLFFFFNNGTEQASSSIAEIVETKESVNAIISDKNSIVSSENKKQKVTKPNLQNTVSNIKNDTVVSSINNTPNQLTQTTSSTLSTNKTTDNTTNYITKETELINNVSTSKTTVPDLEVLPELKTKFNSNSAINVAKSPITITKKLALIPIKQPMITAKFPLAPAIINSPGNTNKKSNDDSNEDDKAPKSKVTFPSSFSPHIYGGTLLTSGKYTQNQQRNKHSKWLPGYYAGIEFTVLTYKKWKINLGYEHKLAVQLFDFQNVTDFIDNVVVEDAVTSITTNSINGTTSQNHETISTRAKRTRNYLHYNTFRSHAIRTTLVRDFKLSNNLHLMAGFGGSYNLLNQAEGRTIGIDGDTLNYNSGNPIYRKNNFGIDGGFSLGYQIGKVSLQGNFWIEKSLNFSMEPVGEIRPVFYKIGGGMTYSF